VEDRREGSSAVGGLPDAARRRTHVVRRRVTGNAGDRGDASARGGSYILKARRLHDRGGRRSGRAAPLSEREIGEQGRGENQRGDTELTEHMGLWRRTTMSVAVVAIGVQ